LVTATEDMPLMKKGAKIEAGGKIHFATTPLHGGKLLRTVGVFDGKGRKTDVDLAKLYAMSADDIAALAKSTH